MSVKDRGFGSMKKRNPERLKDIATKGSKVAHDKQVAHRWSSDAAKAASQKGLEARRRRAAEEREFTKHLNGSFQRGPENK